MRSARIDAPPGVTGRRRRLTGAGVTAIRAIALVLCLGSPTLAGELTCETTGSVTHCFSHGLDRYLSTEERSGDYIRGRDSEGHAWTTWRHDGRTTTWRTH
jgi:hypothetical protein